MQGSRRIVPMSVQLSRDTRDLEAEARLLLEIRAPGYDPTRPDPIKAAMEDGRRWLEAFMGGQLQPRFAFATCTDGRVHLAYRGGSPTVNYHF